MTRPIRPRRLLWLLPLVLWRLLLPSGFMPGTSADGSAFVVCGMQHSAGGHADTLSAGGPDGRHAGKVCPFSVAGVVAPILESPGYSPRSAPPIEGCALPQPQRVAAAGPVRRHQSRGPPALSLA